MNDRRIEDYVNGIFRDVAPSDKVTEQKEELVVNINERVQDYMREGLSFDTAFENAKNTLGDTGELTAPFEKTAAPYDFGSQTPPRYGPVSGTDGKPTDGPRYKITWSNSALTMLSPFVYVLIGLMSNWFFNIWPFTWFDTNWWAWGWVIIPGSAILCSRITWTKKLVALSPFIYILLGFWFNLWAIGWVVIPIAALFESGLVKVTKE